MHLISGFGESVISWYSPVNHNPLCKTAAIGLGFLYNLWDAGSVAERQGEQSEKMLERNLAIGFHAEPKVMELVRPVIEKHGIDPRQITLLVFKMKSDYEATGSLKPGKKGIIYISSDQYDKIVAKQALTAENRFCIAHELGHIVKNDTERTIEHMQESAMWGAGAFLLTSAALAYFNWGASAALFGYAAQLAVKKVADRILVSWNRQQHEFEADAFAASDPETCKAGISYFMDIKADLMTRYYTREAIIREWHGPQWRLYPGWLQDNIRGLTEQGDDLNNDEHPSVNKRIAHLRAISEGFPDSIPQFYESVSV